MFAKFSLVLAILAFFMFTASAMPTLSNGTGPDSLLGRSYSQRAVEVIAARSEAIDAAAEVVIREEPLSRRERFQHRASVNRRIAARHAAAGAHAQMNLRRRRSPQPEPDRAGLHVIRLAAATDSNALH